MHRMNKWLFAVLLNGLCKCVVIFTKYISSPYLYSLQKQLAQHTDWKNAEASADVHSTPRRVGVANLTLGAPTVDRGKRCSQRKSLHLYFRWFALLMLVSTTHSSRVAQEVL